MDISFALGQEIIARVPAQNRLSAPNRYRLENTRREISCLDFCSVLLAGRVFADDAWEA